MSYGLIDYLRKKVHISLLVSVYSQTDKDFNS